MNQRKTDNSAIDIRIELLKLLRNETTGDGIILYSANEVLAMFDRAVCNVKTDGFIFPESLVVGEPEENNQTFKHLRSFKASLDEVVKEFSMPLLPPIKPSASVFSIPSGLYECVAGDHVQYNAAFSLDKAASMIYFKGENKRIYAGTTKPSGEVVPYAGDTRPLIPALEDLIRLDTLWKKHADCNTFTEIITCAPPSTSAITLEFPVLEYTLSVHHTGTGTRIQVCDLVVEVYERSNDPSTGVRIYLMINNRNIVKINEKDVDVMRHDVRQYFKLLWLMTREL